MAPERLTALDASFLYLERPAMHMHVGGLSILDPATCPTGRLRFEDVRRVVASRLHLAPRFRQKVLQVPFNLARPVWVDDEHFDLSFHLRRAALPHPGGRRELADAVQRVLSRPLDRSKPLWEMYVYEGLEGGLLATLLKVHHCLIDGISGMHIAGTVFDTTPELSVQEAGEPWTPEPPPSEADLVREAIEDQLLHPAGLLVEAARTLVRAPAVVSEALGLPLAGARDILGMGGRPVGPFDVQIGPNRRFAMAEAPLERFKEVKRALGGTVNDVVLTAAAGAIHNLLRTRGERTRGRTLRALVPVSVRSPEQHDLVGNRVAPAFVDLPVGPMGSKRRLVLVREGTRHLKESMMALGADAIINLGTYAPPVLHMMAARLASRGPWFNLVVSNIPAPQMPLYLAGARLLASYPSMPLGENAGLSIACTSLAGTMAFGLTADWDAVPDIDSLARALEDSIAELGKAAGL